MEKLILVGAGGHCKAVIDAILKNQQYNIIGITDNEEKIGESVLGIPVIGTDSELERYHKEGIMTCVITVGSTGNPATRIRLFYMTKELGYHFPNIIHPGAHVSPHVIMGEGNFIASGAQIGPEVKIGDGCIINTASIVEHDCAIGNFVHIAPGVTLSGGVEVGRGSHIGTGSSSLQGIKIGENTIIGLGSVVVSGIGDNVIAYGNPCREIRKNNG